MSEVGIRELKQNASAVIDQAEAGEIVTVTRRGKAVARIVPIKRNRLDELRAAGLVQRASSRLEDLPLPPPRSAGDKPLSEIIREMRDDERY